MRGAPGIQYLFSPFDRLMFTMTPAQMSERFNIDVSHPLFTVGDHREDLDTDPLILRSSEEVIALVKDVRNAFVDTSSIDLHELKKACIREGLIKQTKSHLIISSSNGNTLEIPSKYTNTQKPARVIRQ